MKLVEIQGSMWAVKPRNWAWINLPPFIVSCFVRGLLMLRVPLHLSNTSWFGKSSEKLSCEKHLGRVSVAALLGQTGNIPNFLQGINISAALHF